MAQLGHSDPRFSLRVYTHLMSRRDGERNRLRALVQGADWAETSRIDATDPKSLPVSPTPGDEKGPL